MVSRLLIADPVHLAITLSMHFLWIAALHSEKELRVIYKFWWSRNKLTQRTPGIQPKRSVLTSALVALLVQPPVTKQCWIQLHVHTDISNRNILELNGIADSHFAKNVFYLFVVLLKFLWSIKWDYFPCHLCVFKQTCVCLTTPDQNVSQVPSSKFPCPSRKKSHCLVQKGVAPLILAFYTGEHTHL